MALIILLALSSFAVGQTARPPDMVLVAAGLAMGYIEACGCGGQNAGGLARRVRLISELRREYPDLVCLDVGGQGDKPDRLPLITRSLALMGTAAVGMDADDLSTYSTLYAATSKASLQLTSVVPPDEGNSNGLLAPPTSLLCGPLRGPYAAVLSVAASGYGLDDVFARAKNECHQIKAGGRALLTVLISHLGKLTTEALMQRIPEEDRPQIILLATSSDFSQPTWERYGALWVPVARKGRSLSVITVRKTEQGLQLSSDQQMVLLGPMDDVVHSWVDDYYKTTQATERAGGLPIVSKIPPVSACLPCHQDTVAAWRQHPHAHAVQTLEKVHRDVAACLPCHSESFRRESIRPEPSGDRGVVCATCHRGLEQHLAAKENRPATIAKENCRSCHSRENSPYYDEQTYWKHVTSMCQGKLLPLPQHPQMTSEKNVPRK